MRKNLLTLFWLKFVKIYSSKNNLLYSICMFCYMDNLHLQCQTFVLIDLFVPKLFPFYNV